jgi:hypothetical protein
MIRIWRCHSCEATEQLDSPLSDNDLMGEIKKLGWYIGMDPELWAHHIAKVFYFCPKCVDKVKVV